MARFDPACRPRPPPARPRRSPPSRRAGCASPRPTASNPAARAASTSAGAKPPSGPIEQRRGAGPVGQQRPQRTARRLSALEQHQPPRPAGRTPASAAASATGGRHHRNVGPTALPGRLARDLLPARALAPGVGTRHRTLRDDGNDARDAQLGASSAPGSPSARRAAPRSASVSGVRRTRPRTARGAPRQRQLGLRRARPGRPRALHLRRRRRRTA